MDDVVTFDLEGFDDLVEDFKQVAEEAPDAMAKAMRQTANRFRRDVRKRTPVRSGRVSKSYKIRSEGFGLNRKEIFYAERKKKGAYYFTPLEEGHRVVPRKSRQTGTRKASATGKTFVEGRHMVRDTAEDYKDIYPKELEKALEKVLKNVK